MNDAIDRQVAPWRFTAILFSLLAALALVVAMIGLYALLARQVVERTREIGIRMALGARREQIVRFVAGRAIRVVTAGLMSGLIAAMFGGRVIKSLLFGVSTTDALTYVIVAVILFVTAGVGAYWPIRRATAVDPIVALKQD